MPRLAILAVPLSYWKNLLLVVSTTFYNPNKHLRLFRSHINPILQHLTYQFQTNLHLFILYTNKHLMGSWVGPPNGLLAFYCDIKDVKEQVGGIIILLLLGYRVFTSRWSDVKKFQVDLFCCAT